MNQIEQKPEENRRGETVVQLKGITKRFPGVVANDKIDFELRSGEIHALLGENGAGKTTLMNILFGIYQPDEGEIYFHGKKVVLRSPKDAIALGIGMVHQHFMLVPTLTVTENVIIGLKSGPFLLDTRSAAKKIEELSKSYGLSVNPRAIVGQLSVGEQQRIEILKALYRGAQVLILDEPTAVLTPLETKQLMEILTGMARSGLAVLPFITHKLPEVMAISDRVTVLRDGEVVLTGPTKELTEGILANKMIGRDLQTSSEQKSAVSRSSAVLTVDNIGALSDKGTAGLKDVSFSLYPGEILGVAGVSGNGQVELAEVITGFRKATSGKVMIMGKDVTNHSIQEIIRLGVSYIPEDRIGIGAIGDFSVAENLVLDTIDQRPFVGVGGRRYFLDFKEIDKHAEKLIQEYHIATPGTKTRARSLSGGNLQKLILARELSRDPKILIAAQPTRGLDVGATEDIRRIITDQRGRGIAIILISEDLEEVMMMSDRIAVMYSGEVMGIREATGASVEEIGLMMAGIEKGARNTQDVRASTE